MAKLETGGFTKIRACIIQLSLACCWILHSNAKFVTQIEFAVKEQGRVDEIVTSATTLCTRRRERERNVSADGSLCCHTLTRILYSFALVFKRLKHRGTSLNGPMLSLSWIRSMTLLHNRLYPTPSEHNQQICVDWLASAVVSTQRTNIASILTMVYANNLFCEDWLTHYLELRRVPKMHFIQGNIFMYHIQI